MDPAAHLCLDNAEEDISQPWLSISYLAAGIGEANAGPKELRPSTLAAAAEAEAADNDDENASLRPITPVPSRESDFASPSPLTLAVSSANSQLHQYPSSANIQALRSPKDALFDPFAPGPDIFLLAPRSRKYAPDSRLSPCSVHGSPEEDILFQTLYRNLLEAIIWMQTQGTPSAKVPCNILLSDGFQTPAAQPRLCGVAETSPAAPLRPSRKFRHINKSLCRKLEF